METKETFEIEYRNTASPKNGIRFSVREHASEPHHYLISDGKSHVGGGRLAKKYCFPIGEANKSILIKGKDLTPHQKSIIKFLGMQDQLWIDCHSFWFTADGATLSSEPNEYYPVCNSLAFLPY